MGHGKVEALSVSSENAVGRQLPELSVSVCDDAVFLPEACYQSA
jgi:hypothetical protein